MKTWKLCSKPSMVTWFMFLRTNTSGNKKIDIGFIPILFPYLLLIAQRCLYSCAAGELWDCVFNLVHSASDHLHACEIWLLKESLGWLTPEISNKQISGYSWHQEANSWTLLNKPPVLDINLCHYKIAHENQNPHRSQMLVKISIG